MKNKISREKLAKILFRSGSGRLQKLDPDLYVVKNCPDPQHLTHLVQNANSLSEKVSLISTFLVCVKAEKL
jgi:hypothetical protein